MKRLLVLVIVLLLLAITIYRCFAHLETKPYERWDEETNITVLSGSQHSFPFLYLDLHPFFEKPPLWYYINIFSPFSPRILSAVSGFFVILLTVYISWKWWGVIAGIISWIILLTTNHLFVSNPAGIFSTHTFRSADIDSLFILFFMLAFYTQNPNMKGFWAALSVLTRGPLGLLPIINSPRSWITALVVILPWYMYMSIVFGMPFWSEHIGYHVIERIFMPIEGHVNPIWHYASLIGNRSFFLSWELLAFALSMILLNKKLKKDARAVMAAILTILLFLIPTCSQTRLSWYILPMYPFAALVIGRAVSHFI